MKKHELHPLVKEFKQFVNENKKIAKLVQDGSYTLQELFEEWYLLGSDDPHWSKLTNDNNDNKNDQKTRQTDEKTKKEKKTSDLDLGAQLFNFFKKIDPKQLDGHLNSLSRALGAFQGVVSQFQNAQPQHEEKNDRPHPFHFRQD